jgi:hypothetical protein
MSFKRLDPEDLVVSAESITGPVWTGNPTALTQFFTSSAQSNSQFYLEIYNTGSSTGTVQFSIAYCDKNGSGSVLFNSAVNDKSPTAVNFGTYRNLVTGDENTDIKFNGVAPEYFYAITFDRARYREKLLPGTFELTLSGSGAAGAIVLKDDSDTTNTLSFNDAGRVYNIIKTSPGAVTSSVAGTGSWGLLLPDIGTVLLNGPMLDKSTNGLGGVNLSTARTGNSATHNERKLYDVINRGANFKVNFEETISSNFVFVRSRNSEFNYSNNPSYITGSGELRYNIMIDDPRAYFTTVGLYNDNNDLLAVAKLSRPLLKDSRKEALVRIKLDY